MTPLPACLIPTPAPAVTHLDLRCARDLRVCDIVRVDTVETDLIEVEILPSKTVKLRWSVEPADVMYVSGYTGIVVVGRMPC